MAPVERARYTPTQPLALDVPRAVEEPGNVAVVVVVAAVVAVAVVAVHSYPADASAAVCAALVAPHLAEAGAHPRCARPHPTTPQSLGCVAALVDAGPGSDAANAPIRSSSARVDDEDSSRSQLIADAVGDGEVASSTCSAAFSYQCVRLRSVNLHPA
jgi:hypothetical protein